MHPMKELKELTVPQIMRICLIGIGSGALFGVVFTSDKGYEWRAIVANGVPFALGMMFGQIVQIRGLNKPSWKDSPNLPLSPWYWIIFVAMVLGTRICLRLILGA